MSPSWFVFGELFGAVRRRSGTLLAALTLSAAAFLLAFSGLFLVAEVEESVGELGPSTLAAHLSPTLTTRDVEALYLDLRGRSDVRSLSYLFGQEVGKRGGGVLRIEATGPDAAARLGEDLRSTSGVARVEGPGRQSAPGTPLDPATRLGLLIALAVTLVATVFLARIAYGALLGDFEGEIRLLRLSGVPEATLQWPLILLGGIVGLAAALFALLVLTLLHVWTTAQPGALGFAPGLASAGRVTLAALVSIPLGLLLGALGGVLGASLVGVSGSRRRPHS